MAIEPLLWFCLKHETSVTEERLALSIDRRREDETILLFNTDSPAFREHFYGPDDPQIACDALFFYKYSDKSPVLIFIELKGANFQHALEQLKRTILAVKPRIERVVRGSTRYLALVVTDGAQPTTRMNAQRDFIAKTSVRLNVKTMVRGKRAVDLREVLRSVDELAAVVAD